MVETEARYDAEAGILSGLWHLVDSATGENLGVEPLEQRVKQFFPADVSAAFARAGLRIVEYWGDLDRSPPTEASRRQIYVAQKA